MSTASNPPVPSSEATFLYREDEVLFGLLVLHELCEAQDRAALVHVQRKMPERPNLLTILGVGGGFTDKNRRDVEELITILKTPALRNHLPSSFPEVDTIVEVAERTVVDVSPAAPTRHLRPGEDEAQPPTPRPALLEGDATLRDSQDGTVDLGALTDDQRSQVTREERQRIESARVKDPLIGKELSGHLLMDKLGSGGQGDVYLSKQFSLNRYVALKKLEVPEGVSPQRFVDAFRKEAQTLARINHARIVKVFEIFESGRNAFFTMEYIAGKTVGDLVKSSGGGLPVDLVANLACQACSALSRTAADGLIHRDIKAANMMVDENGDLKIVDFGLAEAAAAFKPAGSFAGTPQYASPEQCQLGALTPSSDQYSLGVVFYYALTGQLPFKAKSAIDYLELHVSATPPPPSAINESVPAKVDAIVMKMLAKKPEDRFADFDAVYDAWEKVIQGTRTNAATGAQLLGESLLRIGRGEKKKVTQYAMILGAAWVLVMAGTILGEVPLRRAGLREFLAFCGTWGTWLLVFSLSCIAYVAMARRRWLPVIGNLKVWLYTHIITAVISVIMLLIHSGNVLSGIMPTPPRAKPILSILMATVLIVTAISGSVGFVIFRTLRRQLQIEQLNLRGAGSSEREAFLMLLSAQVLSGWRLVHYPLAVFFVLLSILHIIMSLRFS